VIGSVSFRNRVSVLVRRNSSGTSSCKGRVMGSVMVILRGSVKLRSMFTVKFSTWANAQVYKCPMYKAEV
jgi:hypothetical protein